MKNTSDFGPRSFIPLPFFIGMAVLLMMGTARAVGEAPSAPFVAVGPDNSEWIITFTYDTAVSSDTKDPAPVVKEMRIGKVGNTRRELSIWTNGASSENWYVGSILIQQQPTWPPGFLVASKLESLKDDFKLFWVNPTYFKQREKLNGRDCYLYEAPDSVVEPEPRLSDEMRAQANDPSVREDIREMLKSRIAREQRISTTTTKVWIDKETLLPVQIYGGGVRKNFEFTKTQPKMEMPPGHQKELSALKALYPDP